MKEADVRMGELKELEEAVELTQGETVVAVVSEEELKEALEHATPTGDLEVVEEVVEEPQVDSTDLVDTPAEQTEQ